MKINKFKSLKLARNYLVLISFITALFINSGSVLAAGNVYTVTGGNPGSLNPPGGVSVSVPTIIITDTSGGAFTDIGGAGEDVAITLNAAYYPAVVWDTSGVPTIDVSSTCADQTVTGITYSGALLGFNLAGGACTAGQTIKINGLSVKTQYALVAPGLTPLINVDNITTLPGGAISTTDTVNLSVTAADAVASVTLGSNATVGAAGNTDINFTLPVALTTNDTVEFTLPANLNVASEAYGSQSFGGGGNFTCLVSTQTITCTSTGTVSAATGYIRLTGITSKYAATSQTITNLAVKAQGITANVIASDSSGAVTNTVVAATLSATNVEPLSLVIGIDSLNTISFTTHVTIANLGKIAITYPSGWDLTSANAVAATNLSGLDGTWTTSVSGQVITLTQTGGSQTTAGVKSLVIPHGIMTTFTIGSGGTYTITTEDPSGGAIETDTAVTADNVTASGSYGGSWSPSQTQQTQQSTQQATQQSTQQTTQQTTQQSTQQATQQSTQQTTQQGTQFPVLTDIAGHWANTAIQKLVEKNIIAGNPDGTFKPDANLNRAEAAVLLYRILGLGSLTAPTEKPFSDVEINAWYAGYINSLKTLKLVGGNPNGTYLPGANMNRAEFLTMAMNIYYYLADATEKAAIDALKTGTITTVYKDLDSKAWYASVVTVATTKGFVKGSTCGTAQCFNPASNITRAEAVTILYNMFSKHLGI